MSEEIVAKSKEEKENTEILNRYRALLRSIEGKTEREDKKLIRKAFNLAVDAHKNVRRKSGEPFHEATLKARIASKQQSL